MFIHIYRAFWWRSSPWRNDTSSHQRTPAATSGHQQPPADTSSHQRTPAATSAATSGHQQPPADTSSHQRTPAATSGHQRTPAATSSHQRTPAATSGHQRTPADTSGHQQTPADTRHGGPGIYYRRTGSQRDTSHVARRGVFFAKGGKNIYFNTKLSDCYSVLKGIQKKATGFRPIAFIYFMYCPFYIRFLLVSLLKIKNL